MGLSFQVQFVKLDYVAKQEFMAELGVELKKHTLYSAILTKLQSGELTKHGLATALSIEKISGYMNRTIQKQLDKTLIERTISDTPTLLRDSNLLSEAKCS